MSVKEIVEKGLSADCKLAPAIALAITMAGKEHPCDRCNIGMDRKECRGYPRTTSLTAPQ